MELAMPKVIRTCEYCGRDYETFPSVKPRFCSSACAGAAKRSGEQVACAYCGTLFYRQPSRPDARYCSKSCARSAANRTDRNPSYSRDISGERNPMFGKGLAGALNGMFGRKREQAPRWKGGREVRKDGYVLIIAPDNHPYPAYVDKRTGTKYILEHRWVMEQYLGRYLDPEEVVHHIDGNPSHNDIENLQLFASQSEHIRVAHPNQRTGEQSHLWRGGNWPGKGPNWQKIRRAVLERDNYTCQRCGITEAEYGRALDVHHIQRRGDYSDQRQANRLENLITLCDRCHGQIERSF